jgi:hypothetical protein
MTLDLASGSPISERIGVFNDNLFPWLKGSSMGDRGVSERCAVYGPAQE